MGKAQPSFGLTDRGVRSMSEETVAAFHLDSDVAAEREKWSNYVRQLTAGQLDDFADRLVSPRGVRLDFKNQELMREIRSRLLALFPIESSGKKTRYPNRVTQFLMTILDETMTDGSLPSGRSIAQKEPVVPLRKKSSVVLSQGSFVHI